MDQPIINKIANSSLVTLDLEKLLPAEKEIMLFDLKPFLFKEMILREKDFRKALPQHDATAFQDKYVAVTCTADALIPMWAYMLAAAHFAGKAKELFFGSKDEAALALSLRAIAALPLEKYQDARIILKGCGQKPLSEALYLAATQHLLPVVKSLMYGEPCSTVPIFKK